MINAKHIDYRILSHPEIGRIEIFPDANAAAERTAEKIIDIVSNNSRAAISFATGNTMIPVYKATTRKAGTEQIDFSDIQAFHLDEYFPCNPNEPYSFVQFLRRLVFDPLNIHERFEINGLADNPEKEAERYENLLQQRKIALAILGIGPNGHIGFNESGTPFNSRTHYAALSVETVKRDRDRGQDSPDHAITQGIYDILAAERIVLTAYGEEKGKYLKEALYGEISSNCPASALRKAGSKVTVIIDENAASRLQ